LDESPVRVDQTSSASRASTSPAGAIGPDETLVFVVDLVSVE